MVSAKPPGVEYVEDYLMKLSQMDVFYISLYHWVGTLKIPKNQQLAIGLNLYLIPSAFIL